MLMGYQYEFDDKSVGNLQLTRSDYETLQEGYRLLRGVLEEWNERVLEHGAAGQPYEIEVRDLERMIEWGGEQLSHAERREIVVDGISVGSLRYAKAALMLMIQRREEDRAEKARQGWPDATLRSLDDGIKRIRKIARSIQYEPSDVLWEVIPREASLGNQERTLTSEWDAFVCHASEDKEDFVRPLAQGLIARSLIVWFDEFTLTVGDSLRRSIDRGLARSRFGIVVISPNFLRKEWPQKELDGLVAREIDGTKVILPVWHNITADEIRAYSPMLADRLAAVSSKGLDHVIEDLTRAIGAGNRVVAESTSRIAPPGPQADVRITLRGPGDRARFMIENWGPSVARDVTFVIEPKEGQGNPLVEGDYTEKLPIEILRPGAHVELIAALSFGTGTTFTVRWSWRDENGEMQERREKVSLQSY